MDKLPELPDAWIEVINGLLQAASDNLEKARTLDDARFSQGEIKAYRTILTARAASLQKAAFDAQAKAKAAAIEEAENERKRTPAWRRIRDGIRERSGA